MLRRSSVILTSLHQSLARVTTQRAVSMALTSTFKPKEKWLLSRLWEWTGLSIRCAITRLFRLLTRHNHPPLSLFQLLETTKIDPNLAWAQVIHNNQWLWEPMARSRNPRRRLSWPICKRPSWPVNSRETLCGHRSKFAKWRASLTWGRPKSTNGTGTAREREWTWSKALRSAFATTASRWRRTRSSLITSKIHTAARTVDLCTTRACAAAHTISLVRRKRAPRTTLSSLKLKEMSEEN